MGIESLKNPKDGRVQIKTGSFQEAETQTNSIKDKLGDKIEKHIQRPRNPRLKIINIPEKITTDNIEGTIMLQNPEIGIGKGEIIPKFIYETKRHTSNIVVNSKTRKKLINNKVNIGRSYCTTEDYLVAVRCFNCSRFNHRTSNCKGQ